MNTDTTIRGNNIGKIIVFENKPKTLNSVSPPRSCVVIGSTTLAIFCVEQVRAAGHEVRAILATDDVFKTWAVQEGIHREESIISLETELARQSVDWLFSVVNPVILPDSLIRHARGGAFNYHDSPLPRYAGTHATSWALIAQETKYAVSWHTITTSVDAGQIAVQEPVCIDSGDTALSLNLKCYQAARKGFSELLDKLGHDKLSTWSQDASQRTFFRRALRPNAGAYLDWTQSAETLSAIVRALDFGELYSNSLTCPKLYLGTDTVQANQVQLLQQQSNQAPGTLISVNQKGWCVSTKSKYVLVSNFVTLEGNAIDPEVLALEFNLQAGKQLPQLSAEEARKIKQTLETLAPHESFWHDRLARIQTIQLPYERISELHTPKWATGAWCDTSINLSAKDPKWTVIGAFAIYLVRLTGFSQLHLAWRNLRFCDQLPGTKILAPMLPMECVVDVNSPFAKNIKKIEEEVKRLDEKRTYPRDLVCRYPALRAISVLKTAKPWRIGISIVENAENKDALGELLTLQIDQQGRFRLIYDAECLEANVANRMSGHLLELVRSAAADSKIPVAQLNMLSSEERELLVNTWNNTQLPYPHEACVHQLFEQQVNNTPNAIAITFKDKQLSYAQLNDRANRLAHRLLGLNVGPGKHVAILLERSFELVISELAILKTGATYVPLDPAAPNDRHHWIVNDCNAVLLITDNEHTAFGIRVLQVKEDSSGKSQNPNLPGSSLDIAYVMYTSGSTGTPKGVLVRHKGISRLVINNGYAEIGRNDRVAFTANPAFDASTFEMWGPLLNGGRLVIIDRETLLNSESFCHALQAERVNILWLTVCLFNHFMCALTKIFSQLDILIVGGDTLDTCSINNTVVTKNVKRFINVYGVTEATTFATSFIINGITNENTTVPIGRPIANTRIYLLDEHRQLVPQGAIGEIYIGGAGVAYGYLNRPDLTIKRFLPDPHVDDPNARMYKTGDLARYLSDGNLVFLGRNDQQTKIRGFRIEPGEIEAKLLEHPSVRQAVVMIRGKIEKRLIAYVVVSDEVSAKALNEYLTRHLPEYMIPAAFVQLDGLPMTLTGKLDCQALPAPTDDSIARTSYEAPIGSMEIVLADIWRALLNVSRISRHDSFFALGGHSLLAVRLCTRILSLGIDLPLGALYASPTLAALAEAVQIQHDTRNVMRPLITAISRDSVLPLSFAQQRLWFLAQLDGVCEAYHVPFALRLKGILKVRALQQALDTLWSRHESLRSTFVTNNDHPQVRLLDPSQGIPLRQLALKTANQIATACAEETQTRFNLTAGPLIRALLIQLEDNDAILLLTQHHIISDGWSLNVLLNELRTLYCAFHDEQPNPLPPLTIQYSDYAAWQRQWISGERLEEQSAYWKTTLIDAPLRLDLPTDLTRPAQQSFAGDSVPIELGIELTLRLKALSDQHGVTLFMTLLAAWAAVLSRLSGQDDVIIGAPSANRGQYEIESLIGFFVNTLAFRIDLRNRPNVIELLARVKETVVQAQANQDLPFEQVVEIIQPPRRLDYTPIFQVIFAWLKNDEKKEQWRNLTVHSFEPTYNVVKFDLELTLEEINEQVAGRLGYAKVLFNRSTIERHVNYFKTLLEGIVANTCDPVDKIDILDSFERKLLLHRWNDTQTPYPDHIRIHQRFEEQVIQTPNATAIVFGGEQLTYAELNSKANRLAHLIMKLGVSPGDYVATLLERSTQLVIAQLAILKAGAAYVPLDVQIPSERHAWILKDSSTRLVITSSHNVNFIVPVLKLDETALEEITSFNPIVSGNSLDVAYVMYTSGSTGAPKGVLVLHTGVIRLSVNNSFAKFRPGDRVAFISNPAFDASTFEIWGALLNGGTLIILDRETVLNPPNFYQVLREERIDVLLLTVAHFNQITATLPDAFSQLHTLIVGSDVLDPRTINVVLSTAPPKYLINAYGPTESTTVATSFHIREIVDEHTTIPIGRPISNTRVYLLDAYGQPVPLGAIGEICIGGAGVARGYLNRSELTAKCFLSDPFAGYPNAFMYRTGDLARYRNDGNIIFLGRKDHQVKIRGFRVELGEIEARLTEHPAVRETVVIARGEREKRLVAYVVADDVNPSELFEHLGLYLPDYMVPAAFVQLNALPLTPNGKLDLRALPEPDINAFAHATTEEPNNPIEIALAEIWRDILGVKQVCRRDSFFALGGHSLLAVQLRNQIASLGVELPLATIFATPTLAALAANIQCHDSCEVAMFPRITSVTRTGVLSPSFAQRRLWFLSQHGGASDAYHIPFSLLLEGHLDSHAWRRALDTIWDRHEALRSIFLSVNGEPEVHLLDVELGFPLRILNAEDATDVTALCAKEAQCSFDLSVGPLIRAVLIPLANKSHMFMVTQHHIISDGWSLDVLMRELNILYEAYRYQKPNPLQPLTINYTDYAAWQRQWLTGDRLEKQRSYWKAALADAPIQLNLPTDRQRPAQQSFVGSSVPIELDIELTAQLQRLSEKHNVTVFTILLAAWGAVLSRLSGQDQIVIGVPSANRGHREVQALIGFFVNTLAIRVDLGEQPCVKKLLTRVMETVIQAQTHQDFPFEEVVEIIKPPRRLDVTPVFQVMFAWQNSQQEVRRWPDLDVTSIDTTYDIVKYDLELNLAKINNRIVGTIGYATALFNKNTVQRQANYLKSLLAGMVLNASTNNPIDTIDIIESSERDLLQNKWNSTQSSFSDQACIHHLFEQQAKRRPNSTAIFFEGETLSYAQLNARANSIAHRLIELEVAPDTRVAICVERSPIMIVGFLAILKAGAAYVPLDSTYPRKRITNMLIDSDPSVVLADNTGRISLGEDALNARLVLDPHTLISYCNANPIVPALTSRHLAYVIYTSGTTGKPKGVMVEHRGVVNLAQDQIARFDITYNSRVLQFASFCFDASIFEIIMALTGGASLYLLPDITRRDQHRLLDYLHKHSITHVTLPPILLQTWKDHLKDTNSVTYILAGEALHTAWLQGLLKRNRVFNAYGLTEGTICSTVWRCQSDYKGKTAPIGCPISNTRIYILDIHRHLAPLGAVGELYIGGDGVARGYLNSPDLTAQYFFPDPFVSDENARMYKSGDLAYYLGDGNIVFIGRNDQQTKIRGFRIELGEIESALIEHSAVHEAAVIPVGESNTRLVAYIVADKIQSVTLHEYLSVRLPDFMLPSVFVQLDAFPLTRNGKIDRRALLATNENALSCAVHEEPVGRIEIILANIWRDLLGIEKVSRYDSFFALGGNSLLAAQVIEQLRHQKLSLTVRNLFQTPVLKTLASTLEQYNDIPIPPNRITRETDLVTPELLPLIDLTQEDINQIIARVPGGIKNLQDIYALSPLQDGLLFHHFLTTDSDLYLGLHQIAFAARAMLSRYLDALQDVVNRHDVLRTAFISEGVSVPAQVVWRYAPLSITELTLSPRDGPITEQLFERFTPCHYRINTTEAPLLRCIIAQDEINDRWILLTIIHHLICDHASLDILHMEVHAILENKNDTLPPSVPYRNFIAQTRSNTNSSVHEHFFKQMLTEITEPTQPFGLSQVHQNDSQISEAHRTLSSELNRKLRVQAKRMNVTVASLCHVAWGQVLSRISGQTRVVFGTVLFGRMQTGKGANRAVGLFINTLPFRLDLDDTEVASSVQNAHVLLAALLEHEHASLTQMQRCSGLPAGTPLLNAMLNYRHNMMLNYVNSKDIEFLEAYERTEYPITLSVEDFGTALGLHVQVYLPVDSERVCGYMETALQNLAEALELSPKLPIRKLRVLPETEREILLKTWNDTQAVYPHEACVHQLFERQVDQTPNALAILFESERLSYEHLNGRANQLAHQLLKYNVVPDTLVAICVSRSSAMIVGLLAILKAGAAYVPLDPDHPSERLEYILNDANPVMVLADSTGRRVLGDALFTRIVLDPNDQFIQPKTNLLVPNLTSRHLAYVMYTSGSTGTPKGVQIEHQTLINHLVWMQRTFLLTPYDRVLQKTPFSFDVSVAEFFLTLSHGAGLVIAKPGVHQDLTALTALIVTRRVTVVHFIPSMLTLFLSTEWVHEFHDLKYVMCSGETLSSTNVQRFKNKLPHVQLFNLYGPTEATIDVTIWPCSQYYNNSCVPIGRPKSNTKIYVLDRWEEPVPLGAIGEICIGGDTIARGYLNRPELTAERFIPDPFAENPTARIYKTGDLGRYLPDGNLVFLGRQDRQVKIRGFRIELGEIEETLIKHPAVREAAVVALDEPDKRLIAYVVSDEVKPIRLHEYLQRYLPYYMIPSVFMMLEALPLLSNGKLDVRGLPVVEGSAPAHSGYEAPIGPIETTLAKIWCKVLDVERVSRQDSFFALGGHSLLAIRMIEQLRQKNLDLTVRDLFQNPVLATLAGTLVKHKEIVVPLNQITRETDFITPELLPLIDLTQNDIERILACTPGGITNVQDIYALSPLQDGILFHHLLTTNGDPYLMFSEMAFADRITLTRYVSAVQKVVNRHDILRTAFLWENLSAPAQVVWRNATLSVTELVLDRKDGSIPTQLTERFDLHRYRIDLTQAPLMQFVFAEDKSDGRWILLILFHHLIGDHTTLDIMHSEVNAFLENGGNELPPPKPFRDLIAQIRLGVSIEAHERFFKRMLAQVTEPTLPFGLTDVQQDSSKISEAHRMMSSELNQRLRAQSKKLNVSLASLCHVAWAQVLSRTSGQNQVVFNTVLFGRMQTGEGSDRAMGLFINTLPFRVCLDETGIAESVHSTHISLAALLGHEHASLALAQKCSGVPPGTPLTSALLNYRHNVISRDRCSINIELLAAKERTNYPICLSLEDFGTSIGVTVQVQLPIDADRVCGYMEQALTSLAEALENSPNLPVKNLQILPEIERELLLRRWNETQTAYPNNACIHEMFEHQVARTPHAPAILFQDKQFSYLEINSWANKLSHRLIELGVVPDLCVAICVAQSPPMIVAMLATLKSGAAYVPLDPCYPNKRLAYILADVNPKVVLADKAGRNALGDALLGLTVLDPNDNLIQPECNLHIPGLTSRHLAYVIYTSGSTGVPKGVMIEHRSIVNYSIYASERYGTQGSLITSSIAFDLTLTTIFPTLICGNVLHIPRNSGDVVSWCATIALASKLSPVKLTPSHLAMLQDALTVKDIGQHIHTVVLGGEAISHSLLEGWFKNTPTARIFNEYGPTETTVGSTVYEINHTFPKSESIPIGRPIANTRIYLIDDNIRLVPLGVVGEICIGGHGVARGYLNRPDLSAEKFLPDPFTTESNAWMYKTGDIARYLPDGNLVFLGRKDDMIKIRGYRIEPGEIEAKLIEHPAVHEAIVVAIGDSDKRLVAYMMADEVAPVALRQHLSIYLPKYMLPTAFIKIDAFPLTYNGKLDLRALPLPDDNAPAHEAFKTPTGPIEVVIAEIWCEVLGLDQVGRDDSFFALGGHSLLAIKTVQRAINCGLPCSLNDLFEQPLLRTFASRITSDALSKGHMEAIQVRSSGSGQPLFFVPTGLGDHSYVFSLARHIDTKNPIYALPWPSTNHSASGTMEILVDTMIAFMKAVQPEGPYRIAGYSAGGILAYAIAESLLRRNDCVTFVGLIDVAPPHLLRNVSAKYLFLEYLAETISVDRFQTVAQDISKIDFEGVAFTPQCVEFLGTDLPPEFIALAWERINLFSQAVHSYEPVLPPLIIHQFHSTEEYHPRIVIPNRDENVSLNNVISAWKEILPHVHIRFVPIPGDHRTMMNDISNRRHLGEAISRLL